jgi:hypothetical protein
MIEIKLSRPLSSFYTCAHFKVNTVKLAGDEAEIQVLFEGGFEQIYQEDNPLFSRKRK